MAGFKIRYDDKFYDAAYLLGETHDMFLNRVVKEVAGDDYKLYKFTIKQEFNNKLKKIVFEITKLNKKR